MTDASLDRQLAHAYIDRLPPDQLAAIRRLLEGMLDSMGSIPRRSESQKEDDIAVKGVLGDFGLTPEDIEGMSLN